MQRFRWAPLIGPDRFFHIARAALRPGRTVPPHTHDFAEVFWVESGRGTHAANGRRLELAPGTLAFIRPSDRHALRAARDESLVFVNVAFPEPVFGHLRARYLGGSSLWGKGPQPFQMKAGRNFRAWLAAEGERLFAAANTPHAIDLFLLGLLDQANRQSPALEHPELPEWLARACREIAKPEHFERGVPAFVRLAGRCPEHVARGCRRWLGRTPTDVLNDARMQYVARRLESGDAGILEIALECGLQNLSHFHRLFRQRFGTTPARYRRRLLG